MVVILDFEDSDEDDFDGFDFELDFSVEVILFLGRFVVFCVGFVVGD